MFPLFSSFSKEMLAYAHLIGQHDISGHAGPLQAVAGVSQGGPWQSAQTWTVSGLTAHMQFIPLCPTPVSCDPTQQSCCSQSGTSEHCFE